MRRVNYLHIFILKVQLTRLYIASYSSVMFGNSKPKCFLASTLFKITPMMRAAIPKHANMTKAHV